MEDTTDQIGIIARVVQALQTTNEQGLSGMTRLKEFTMLISPYPSTCYFDSPAEVWTNLGVLMLSIVLAIICICRMKKIQMPTKISIGSHVSA